MTSIDLYRKPRTSPNLPGEERAVSLHSNSATSFACTVTDMINGMQGSTEDAWANKQLMQVVVTQKQDLETENKAMRSILEELAKSSGQNVDVINHQIETRAIEITRQRDIEQLEYNLRRQIQQLETAMFHCKRTVKDLQGIIDYPAERIIKLIPSAESPWWLQHLTATDNK